ncbi:asparagine synthase-related protein [Metabacillus fastidiosus]|uniref:asparagine synthase-related protein n=1 Tax=Metabacillus fastidiosus TaxID=1458 RepID=UPI003D2B90B5
MSAIVGMYHFNNNPVNVKEGMAVMRALQGIPADDTKVFYKENIFFGCRAQWITPESVGEQLPLYDKESRIAITADAIIDNRKELFEKLSINRANQIGMTDSELILKGYQKWGENVPKHLIGDFAFIIWDERKGRLFGARDFSGSRTLYFYKNKQCFAFCTMMTPLFSLPFIERELNRDWLADFLALPNILDSVDASSTVYKNIFQIPPSHSILVADGKVTFSRYYHTASIEKLKLKSNEEYVEAFRDVFQKAVSEQLRTYRNVGTRLSGGLDSGTVAGFAARTLQQNHKQLHTFSYVPVSDFVDWTPKNKLADERPFIKSTVEYIGNIHDHYLDLEGRSPFTEMDDLLQMMEMPYKFFENSYWLKGIYEKAQEEDIGVLLNGGRGNFSISWGPAEDYYATLLKRMRWLKLYNELKLYSENRGVGKGKILSVIGKKVFPFIRKYRSTHAKYHFPMLINSDFARETDVFNRVKEQGIDIDHAALNMYDARKNHFEKVYSWNLNSTSRSKLSLHYSMTDRDPTNDLRVIQFCLSVPESQYVQGGFSRSLVRRATEGYLPDKVRLNQYFKGIQGADGIHRMKPQWNMLIEEIQALCKDPVLSELLNIEVIKNALTVFQSGPKDESIYDANCKVLMRSLIVSRFLKRMI